MNPRPFTGLLFDNQEKYIISYLPLLALSDWSKTTKDTYKYLLEEYLLKIQKEKLICHLVFIPNSKKIKVILECNPVLCDYVFTNVEINLKQTSSGTPLQLSYLTENEEMATTITECMQTQKDGSAKIYQQLERFNNPIPKAFYDFFYPVIQAIFAETLTNGTDRNKRYLLNQVTIDTINQFRENFDTILAKIIQKNILSQWTEILNDIHLKGYVKYLESFLQPPKSNYLWLLFHEAVISKLLEYMPTPISQNFCEGLLMDRTLSLVTKEGYHLMDALQHPSDTFNLNSSSIDFRYGRIKYFQSFSGILHERDTLEQFCKKKIACFNDLHSAPGLFKKQKTNHLNNGQNNSDAIQFNSRKPNY